MEGEKQEIDVGGPEVMTYREIAKLALEAQEKRVKINAVPAWLMRFIIAVTKIFNKHQGELLAFLTTAMTSEVVAPATDTHTLREHYNILQGGYDDHEDSAN
ncbi:hypothetical protein ACFLYF_05120 [Chloroflexota bacterium]